MQNFKPLNARLIDADARIVENRAPRRYGNAIVGPSRQHAAMRSRHNDRIHIAGLDKRSRIAGDHSKGRLAQHLAAFLMGWWISFECLAQAHHLGRFPARLSRSATQRTGDLIAITEASPLAHISGIPDARRGMCNGCRSYPQGLQIIECPNACMILADARVIENHTPQTRESRQIPAVPPSVGTGNEHRSPELWTQLGNAIGKLNGLHKIGGPGREKQVHCGKTLTARRPYPDNRAWPARRQMNPTSVAEQALEPVEGYRMMTESTNTIPMLQTGWLREFSDSDLASLICPRPLLVEQGKADGIAWWPLMMREYEQTCEHYRRLGLEDRLEIDLHEGGHEIRLEKSLDFLRKWLRP